METNNKIRIALDNEVWRLQKENKELRDILRRYRNEVPVGHQPHMICILVDKMLKDEPKAMQECLEMRS